MDKLLIDKIELVLKANKKDWFLDLNAGEKEEIEIGLKQAENNEFISHETVMNKFAIWQ